MARAISLASGYSYAAIQDKLYYISKLLECDMLCVCCYQHLLDDVFKYKKLPHKGSTVEEVANLYPNDKLLIRVDGHLTCSVGGVIRDIWDCSKEIVDKVWKVV